MRLLLDTHTLLCFWLQNTQLSATALQYILNPTIKKYVSVASPWEVAIKVSTGKLTLGGHYANFFSKYMSANNFHMLIPNDAHFTELSRLPFHHRDPFDRLMIAQAIVEQIPIVSADTAFDTYPIRRLW